MNFTKKFISFLIIFISLTISVKSQVWPEIGTTWYYQMEFPFDWGTSYFKFECEKDTLVLGKNCRKIRKYDSEGCEMRLNKKFEITYTSNDSIYLLDSNFTGVNFQLYYYRNAQKNDVWSVIFFNLDLFRKDTIVFAVDSVDTININGKNLKRINVSFEYDSSRPALNGYFIDRIGFNGYLTRFIPSRGACDGPFSTGLRCYTDSFLGTYETGLAEQCDHYSVDIETIVETDNFRVYPNPSTGHLSVDVEGGNAIIELNLINQVGERVFSEKFQQGEVVDLELTVPNGIFYLEMRSNGHRISVQRIVKD